LRRSAKIGVVLGAGLVIVVAVWMATPRTEVAVAPSAEAPKPAAPRLAPAPPPPPPVLDAAPPPPAPKKAAKPKQLSEAELLDKLRKAQDTDAYMLSYELAREGQRRFPNSANAPEFAAMAIKSLARQGKLSEARAEAEVMVNKYVGTHWAHEVERHTGAHPTVNQVPPK
jgi:hypothetical protein